MSEVLETDLDDPVHTWFGLTYSSYLVLPRVLMQEMPVEWQTRFVTCLEEMSEVFDIPDCWGYMVKPKGRHSRFIKDPLCNYRRPDWGAVEACRKKK